MILTGEEARATSISRKGDPYNRRLQAARFLTPFYPHENEPALLFVNLIRAEFFVNFHQSPLSCRAVPDT